MLTRLSRAFLRVLPAILLVVVGLVAALFCERGSRNGTTTLAPTPARRTVPSVRRRGAAIALVVLLLGLGLVLASIHGDGDLRRLGSPLSSSDGDGRRPVAALSPPDGDIGQGKRPEAAAPSGSVTKAEPAGRGGATSPGVPDPGSPTFDTVRVESDGNIVVAGRAAPNGTVELLVDGKPTARAVADANGQFAIVPPALPAGNSEVGLRVTDVKGSVRQSRYSVAVAVAPSHDARPLVALTSPDKPTVVLSQPGSPMTTPRSVPDATSPRRTMTGAASPIRPGTGEVDAGDGASNAIAAKDPTGSIQTENGPGAGVPDQAEATDPGSGSPGAPRSLSSERAAARGADAASTKIVSVDAQEGGRLFVSGQAPAGETVRLYLNDTLIAPAMVGRDGTVTFTIGRGVKPGDYRVRLDQVDAASGKVRSRVEVPFSVPDVARTANSEGSVAPSSQKSPNGDVDGKAAPNVLQAVASSDAARDRPGPEAAPGTVYVPEVKTARIERGDSLWAISRRTYGEGDRYTAIYDANQDQIRDPDLIYPGQVFVLPGTDAIDDFQDGKRG